MNDSIGQTKEKKASQEKQVFEESNTTSSLVILILGQERKDYNQLLGQPSNLVYFIHLTVKKKKTVIQFSSVYIVFIVDSVAENQ